MMTNVKQLFTRITIVLVAICSLVSCDPWYSADFYVRNRTSQTIVFRPIHGKTPDSPRRESEHTCIDSIVLKKGETALLTHYDEMGTFTREEIPRIMEYLYPNGIKIEFEDGESVTYYPDSAYSDFNSPYKYTSFSVHIGENNDATYVVSH